MKVSKNIFKLKKFNVLLVNISNEETLYMLYDVKLDKEIWSVRFVQSFQEFEDVLKASKKNNPFIIHFIGKGIISRKIESTVDLRDKLTVNGDKNDFYFDETHQDLVFVSMTRKDKVDRVITLFKSHSIQIFNISLGYFVLRDLVLNRIHSNVLDLKVENRRIIDFKRSKSEAQNIHYNGSLYDENRQLALAACIRAFDEKEIVNILDEELRAEWRSEIKEKKRFKAIAITILSVVLLFQVANYFFQNSVHKQNSNLEAEIGLYGTNLAQINQIDQEIGRKVNLIRTSGIYSKYNLSFYIDKIVASCPGSISFTSLNVFPLEKKLKQKKKVEIKKNYIYLKGTCSSSEQLDYWIEELESFKWVSKVVILNYSKTEESKSEFFIDILTDNGVF